MHAITSETTNSYRGVALADVPGQVVVGLAAALPQCAGVADALPSTPSAAAAGRGALRLAAGGGALRRSSANRKCHLEMNKGQ